MRNTLFAPTWQELRAPAPPWGRANDDNRPTRALASTRNQVARQLRWAMVRPKRINAALEPLRHAPDPKGHGHWGDAARCPAANAPRGRSGRSQLECASAKLPKDLGPLPQASDLSFVGHPASSSPPAEQPAILALHVRAGQLVGQFFHVTGPMIVGRDPRNALVVPDRKMSRRHLSVEPDGEALLLCDLGSNNGTFVNGEPVASAILGVGAPVAPRLTQLEVVRVDGGIRMPPK